MKQKKRRRKCQGKPRGSQEQQTAESDTEEKWRERMEPKAGSVDRRTNQL